MIYYFPRQPHSASISRLHSTSFSQPQKLISTFTYSRLPASPPPCPSPSKRTFLLSALRDHPSPKAQSETPEHMCRRANTRAKNVRSLWATIRSAALLHAELGEYLHQVVLAGLSSLGNSYPFREHQPTRHLFLHPFQLPSISKRRPWFRDPSSPPVNVFTIPECLSQAHHTYLSSLTHSLLLDYARCTAELRGVHVRHRSPLRLDAPSVEYLAKPRS